MKLNNRQFQRLHTALLDAYTTDGQLKKMVRFELDKNLDEITGFDNLDQTVFDLISWAESNGELLDLLNGAYKQNTGNISLEEVIKSLQSELSYQDQAGHRQHNNNVQNPLSAGFQYPFGERACEHEVKILQQGYRDFYYGDSQFNQYLLDPARYLIVGRRGSGKTSLIEYCSFQTRFRNTQRISIENPEKFQSEWQALISTILPYGNYGTLIIADIWNFILWILIFEHLKLDLDWLQIIDSKVLNKSDAPENKICTILQSILSNLSNQDKFGALNFPSWVSGILKSKDWHEHQTNVLEITSLQPLIITIDTMERYDIQDDVLLQTTAALIECVSNINIFHARCGLHVKVFVASEIFPYIKESVISNSTKYIREPLFLHWTPKDLIRLITWRFYQFLRKTEHRQEYIRLKVDWDNFSDVLNKLWNPFFGETITSDSGKTERTFPFILRHTHMRPRELVIICNFIAKQAITEGVFPYFYKIDNLASMVEHASTNLADETINSYAKIYPNVSHIIANLENSPMHFQGNHLDKIAKHTSSLWPDNNYSLAKFRSLVSELGIIGRVRTLDKTTNIVAADFEYSLANRLTLRNDDECVVHPMFYSKLDVKRTDNMIVYPFPKNENFIDSIMNSI